MADRPVLLVMAAGMGSRYGGLKQIDPVSEQGEIILDFSLYDAMLAGFEEVIFVIKRENEEAFRELIDQRAGKRLNVRYAFQELANIPEGRWIPEGRVKPWGTGHAVLSAKDLITGPFAVINADDYYGSHAFQTMYDFLSSGGDGPAGPEGPGKYRYAMVGYLVEKTLSESGHVARGVCTISPDGKLVEVTERTRIMRLPEGAEYSGAKPGDIAFTEDDGATWTKIPEGTMVSMNFWGYTRSIMDELDKGFVEFIDRTLSIPPLPDGSTPEKVLKAEYYLPVMTDGLLKAGKAEVTVLRSPDQWHGVTYKDDKQGVVDALRSMKDKGFYPEVLWP